MENVEKKPLSPPFEVAIYIYVDEIVKHYQNSGNIIPISSDFYEILPVDASGSIPVPDNKTEISFTATNKGGIDGTQFWLTTFDSGNGSIISGKKHNPMGKNVPANVLSLQLTPNPKIGETQTFTLHCYFITFVNGANEVYHCSLDPNLKISQGGG